MTLIDGKATAAAIKAEIAEEVKQIVAGGGKQPHLAAVLVGHDGGSETYVKNKVLACEACGFKSTLIRYEDNITEEELLQCVDKLNNDPDVDGFIVQLPLPKHINEQKIIEAIDYRKDVDGFHPINDTTWYRNTSQALWHRDIRQEVRCARSLKHCGQAYVTAHGSEAVWRCYRNGLPLSL